MIDKVGKDIQGNPTAFHPIKGSGVGKLRTIGQRRDSGFFQLPAISGSQLDTGGYVNTLTTTAKNEDLRNKIRAQTERAGAVGIQQNTQKGTGQPVDWRARLRPKGGRSSKFWKGENALLPNDSGAAKPDYLLRPLYDSGGLVWQYTPNIFVSGRANYNMAEFYGSNYPLVTYTNSTPPQLVVVEDFTANTIDEARYLLAVMHFLKVATKSFYGDQAVADGMYGTPPPVFLFEYLGDHGFNKVPVVITDYQYQLGDDVDYVPVKTGAVGDETTYVPTVSNISITLQPSYTPHKLRKKFDLNKFTTGANYKHGFI